MEAAAAGKRYAIVGIGCRLPGGVDSPAAFWTLISEGRDAIVDVPDDRPDWHRLYDADPAAMGRIYARAGGFIDGIDQFDARFFGISPREAARIDPQQRLLLEVVWHAFEDANIPIDGMAATDVGVFVGISTHDYADVQMYPENRDAIDAHSNTGGATSIAANRVSYAYDFRGPSIAVDTACSSALTAVHLACRALDAGDCSIAVACGVQLLLRPELTVGFCRATMLSVDGRCKAFDAAGNGYVRSEGAGAVILKPLERALTDGDAIHAVILGSAINQDGHSSGLTVPNEVSQQAMLRESLRRAGVRPCDVHYVEAHGTGTAVGDPIEARAIGAVFGEGRDREHALWIGSAKTNIGHLEAASGIAGLIKAALSVQRRKIPAVLHFSTWNPNIDADGLKLRIATTLTDWPQNDGTALAAVNSFGFGGANASVVLASAPDVVPVAEPDTRAQLFMLSARSPEALRAGAIAASEQIRGAFASVSALCAGAALGRVHHAHRVGVVGTSHEALADALDSFAVGEAASNIAVGTAAVTGTTGIAFVFSGMGPQWWGMGRQLLDTEPVFAAMLERCDRALRPLSGWSLLDEFRADESTSRLAHPQLAQVSNFALQVALAELWASWGVRPAAVIGHSGGAMAAACVAGVHTLEDAIRLAYHRSNLQGRPSNGGGMLAVGLPASEAPALLRGREDRISLAAVNGPSAMTLAGDPEVLASVAEELVARKVFARMLAVTIAYHSPAMDPIRDEFLGVVAGLRGAKPVIPLVSDTTGGWADDLAFDAAYWWRAIRSPVLFADGVGSLIEAGFTRFVEISPHPVLATSLAEGLAARETKGLVVASLRRNADERGTMLQGLAALHVNGCAVDWSALYRRDAHVDLPLYRWQKERHWFEPAAQGASPASGAIMAADDAHPLLQRRVATAQPTWDVRLDVAALDYLGDHLIEGTAVFPGAGYVEMALAAARRLDPEGDIALRDVEFLRPLVIADRVGMTMQIVVDPDDLRFDIHARGATDGSFVHYATGRISKGGGTAAHPADVSNVQSRLDLGADGVDFYRGLRDRGLHYGHRFKGVRRLQVSRRDAVGAVGPLATLQTEHYAAHPALLDAAFQLLASVDGGEGQAGRLFLPTRIDEIRWHASAGDTFFTRCALQSATAAGVTGSVELCAVDGTPLLSVRGLQARFVDAAAADADAIDGWLYDYRWETRALGVGGDGLARRSLLAGDFPTWRSAAPEIIRRLQRDTDWPRYYDTAEAWLSRVAAAQVVAAFASLGAFDASGTCLTQAAFDAVRADEPSGGLWADRLLALLLEAGVAEPADDGWNVRTSASIEPGDAHLAAYATDLALLIEAGRTLPDALARRSVGKDAVFTADALPLLARFYDDAPASAFYNRLLASAIGDLVEHARPQGRLRILEVGAGTGGSTRFVLDRLDGVHYDYLCTDSAAMLVDGLRERFAAFPSLRASGFDLTRDAAEQGLVAGSFDLVIAANVVHATPDVAATLARLRELLAPNGCLALIEITRRPYWLDVIFGQTRGWWAFTDRALRHDQPLLPASSWRALLNEAGFTDVHTSAEEGHAGESAQTVLLAATPDSADAGASWLVLGSADRVTTSVRRGLESLGQRAQVAEADAARLVLGAATESMHVVLVLGGDAVAASAEPAFASVHVALGAIQSVLAHATGVASFWIVTTGAARIERDSRDDVLQSPIAGLARTVLKERPELFLRLVDIGVQPTSAAIDGLLREMLERDPDEEIALRDGRRYVRRLTRSPRDVLKTRDWSEAGSAAEWHADVATRGSLASLHFRAFEPAPLLPHEVRIEVRAASLNFRDVMLAMGGIPGLEDELSFGHRRMGSDCAGVVTALGSQVTTFAIGDSVIAMAAGSLGSSVTTAATLVAPKPTRLSFEEAAGVPTAFLTAWYSLVHLARLQAGERVLIHAATGGVGLAAIQVARLIGAEVFATAGSVAKREHLATLGIVHIADSRSLAFAEQVREWTRGVGVDVVLNSLAGEAIGRGIASLAPYGRFVEIGKRDIYTNRAVALSPFRQNLSFLAVDLDRLCAERPHVIHAMLAELAPHFASGALTALPLQRFGMPRIEDAFRLMAQAKHIGKIVLTSDPAAAPPTLRDVAALPRIRTDASYLVTGGLGGFGIEVAAWLAARGAGAIVLMGRSTPTTAVGARLDALRGNGARIEVVSGDVGRGGDIDRVMALIDASMPPLGGVFHAAMVLDDRRVEDIDAASLDRVLAPKARGAWLLHQRTRDRALDHFVMFSSISSVLGNPLQANYAAASAFLDALAAHRASAGLPALSINWGVLAGAGYVAARPELESFLDQQGYRAFSVAQALHALSTLLTLDMAGRMVAQVDWRRLADYSPRAAASPRIAALVPLAAQESNAVATSAVLAELVATAPAARAAIVEPYLAAALARVLGLVANDIERDKPIDQLGLDSLLAVEFAMVLTRELGVELPVISLLGGMTIARLTAMVLAELPQTGVVAVLPPLPVASAIALPTPLPASPTAVAATIEAAPSSSHAATATADDRPTAGAVDYGELDYTRWSPLQRLSRGVSRVGLFCVGDVAIEGIEHLPQSGAFILAVNHLSMADVPLALTIMPRRTIILATAKLKQSRLLDWLVADVGQAIYVQADDDSTAPLEQALRVLANGGVVALSPEGARSRSGLIQGQTGVAWLAMRANVPVIPYVAWGQERWRARFRQWGRLPIHVRIGPAVDAPSQGSGSARAAEHTRRIMRALASLLPHSYRGVYADTDVARTDDEAA